MVPRFGAKLSVRWGMRAPAVIITIRRAQGEDVEGIPLQRAASVRICEAIDGFKQKPRAQRTVIL
jgi:hypothetical protein